MDKPKAIPEAIFEAIHAGSSTEVVSSSLRVPLNNKSTTQLLDRETCEFTRGTMFDVLEFFGHHAPEHQPSIEILAALSAILLVNDVDAFLF